MPKQNIFSVCLFESAKELVVRIEKIIFLLDSPFIERGYIDYMTSRYYKLIEAWGSAQTGILRFTAEMNLFISGRYWYYRRDS